MISPLGGLDLKIHIARSGKTYGPYTEGTIRRYLAAGSVSSEDLAWTKDVGGWVDLKQILADSDIPRKKISLRLTWPSRDATRASTRGSRYYHRTRGTLSVAV